MINEFYKDMTGKGSVIRQFFDYANKKGAEIGMENIYNFSIGNPSVPVPQAFTNRMIELLQTEDPVKLHSYSPSLGLPSTRQAVADSLNKRFGMNYTMDHIFMTSAAAQCAGTCASVRDKGWRLRLSPLHLSSRNMFLM